MKKRVKQLTCIGLAIGSFSSANANDNILDRISGSFNKIDIVNIDAIPQNETQKADRSGVNQSNLSLFVFGGSNVRGFQSFPFESTPGDQKLFGASVAWVPVGLPFGFETGVDGGVAIRDDGDQFAPGGTSAEIWLGPTLRHNGFSLGPILIKPAVTIGFSLVTASNGLERAREVEDDGNAALLYYIGPEIGISLKSLPNIDLVYRLQHRSGAERVSYLPTIGGISDTNNANLFGLRYHF